MAKCEACEGIDTSRLGAPGHDALKETSSRKENWGQGAVHFTEYVCTTCGTKWCYENDRKDPKSGWYELT